MNIIRITVKAGRVFNHPHENYSNLQPSVELIADVGPGEDAIQCARLLQEKAEMLVESHKQAMLEAIDQLVETAKINSQIEAVKQNLEHAKNALAEFERRRDALKQPELLSASAE
jgi:hypothetical protein